MTDVIAIPATPALHQQLHAFLGAVQQGGDGAGRFIEMVDGLTQRMLTLMLTDPAAMARLSPTQSKVVDFAVATCSKASSLLTRQIYRKVSNEEFAPIVRNVRALSWEPGPDNDDTPHVALPVEPGYARDFEQAVAAAQAGQGQAQMPLLSRVIDGLTDRILDGIFLEQTRHVKMGFVTEKALKMGVEGARSALHALTPKVLKGLSDDDLALYLGYFGQFLKQRDTAAAEA